MALGVTVRFCLVESSPLGRRIAGPAFLTLHLPSSGTTLLHKRRAVTLDLSERFAILALIGA